VYAYTGSSSLTSTELQTGNENDCVRLPGASNMSGSYSTGGFVDRSSAADAAAAALAAADAIDYRLFRSTSSGSAQISIQMLTGSNSNAWNLDDSGTSRACVFTREYSGNFE
jgi:hypothetical protein